MHRALLVLAGTTDSGASFCVIERFCQGKPWPESGRSFKVKKYILYFVLFDTR